MEGMARPTRRQGRERTVLDRLGARARRAVWMVLAVALCGGACAQMDASIQMALGNPTNAAQNPLFETDYLIQRPQYAVGYSRWDAVPRWVSWHLVEEDLGGASRGSFRTDTSLPSGWYRVTDGDYSGSGYTRGHMCPSGDRTVTDPDNDTTFYMTNMIPQTADNNNGPWAKLEEYCRTLARAGNELYIICGPRGLSKRLTGKTGTGNFISVPTHVWKVIVVLPKASGNDAARVTPSTRVIAVDMPNIDGINTHDWQRYRVSVDTIEANTGFEFLSNVPVAVQTAVEARVDAQ